MSMDVFSSSIKKPILRISRKDKRLSGRSIIAAQLVKSAAESLRFRMEGNDKRNPPQVPQWATKGEGGSGGQHEWEFSSRQTRLSPAVGPHRPHALRVWRSIRCISMARQAGAQSGGGAGRVRGQDDRVETESFGATPRPGLVKMWEEPVSPSTERQGRPGQRTAMVKRSDMQRWVHSWTISVSVKIKSW